MVPMRLIRLLDDAAFAGLITVVFVTFVMVVVVVVVNVWLRCDSLLFELAVLLVLAVLYVRDFNDEPLIGGGGVEHAATPPTVDEDDDGDSDLNLSATSMEFNFEVIAQFFDFNGDKQK